MTRPTSRTNDFAFRIFAYTTAAAYILKVGLTVITGNLTISWGDGSANTVVGVGGPVDVSHTYAAAVNTFVVTFDRADRISYFKRYYYTTGSAHRCAITSNLGEIGKLVNAYKLELTSDNSYLDTQFMVGEIRNLKKAQYLDLRHSQYSTSEKSSMGAGEISSLPLLTFMNLTYMPQVVIGPGEIRSMTQLQYLYTYELPLLTIDYGDLPHLNLLGLSLGGYDVPNVHIAAGETATQSNLINLWCFGASMDWTINAGEVATLTKLQDLELYNVPASINVIPTDFIGLYDFTWIWLANWTAAQLDAVLAIIYAQRMLYTDIAGFGYNDFDMTDDGGVTVPTGIYQDAAPPTTGMEYIYKLVNDPDTEGFVPWEFFTNGGDYSPP